MLYLLAAVGAVAIGIVLWKLVRLGDQATPYPDRTAGDAQAERKPKQETEQRIIGPDDDPEFLRSLDERNRGND